MPVGSRLRRRLVVVSVIAVVATGSACSGEQSGPGTAGATKATQDTTSGPATARAASPSPRARARTSAAPTATRSIDPRAGIATATVSRFYSAYLAAPGKQTAARYLSPQLLDALFSAPREVDRVLCAHALPTAVAAVPGAVKGKNATVTVTATQQDVALPSIQVTVRLADQRIIAIDCSR
jgi:hypothetical protein